MLHLESMLLNKIGHLLKDDKICFSKDIADVTIIENIIDDIYLIIEKSLNEFIKEIIVSI